MDRPSQTATAPADVSVPPLTWAQRVAPQNVAQTKLVNEALLHSLAKHFNLNPMLPTFPLKPINPDFVILETPIHPTFKDLDNASPALLTLLHKLNILLDTVNQFNFAPKGIQVIFNSPTPISKFMNTAYQVGGLGLLPVHKPFNPTWVFSGLSDFPDNQINECLKAYRSVKEHTWLNTQASIKLPFMKVTFNTITPALMAQHYPRPTSHCNPHPTSDNHSCDCDHTHAGNNSLTCTGNNGLTHAMQAAPPHHDPSSHHGPKGKPSTNHQDQADYTAQLSINDPAQHPSDHQHLSTTAPSSNQQDHHQSSSQDPTHPGHTDCKEPPCGACPHYNPLSGD